MATRSVVPPAYAGHPNGAVNYPVLLPFLSLPEVTA